MDERNLTREERIALWKQGVKRSVPELRRQGDPKSANELEGDVFTLDGMEAGGTPVTRAQKASARRIEKDLARLP